MSDKTLSESMAGADDLYRPFEGFEAWADLETDQARIARYRYRLKEYRQASSDLLHQALGVVRRAAAVETGAIEDLYTVDRGFTFTVATEAALWEAAVEARGEQARSLIRAQLEAYDFVLDFATERVEIAEAWIRQLHEEICRGQATYVVETPQGSGERPLPLGAYKTDPNHVITVKGTVHSYAPVIETGPEMERLVRELRTERFQEAPAPLQAAFSHYALVSIHPFADGNGRVARALASVFTYRSDSVPLLILAEQKEDYFKSLALADAGGYQEFLDFISMRFLDALLLVDESVKAAKVGPVGAALEKITSLHLTRGGYTHAEVDQAGAKLLDLATKQFSRIANETAREGQFQLHVSNGNATYELKGDYRQPLILPNFVQLSLASPAPAKAAFGFRLAVEVPRDCGERDDLVLTDRSANDQFSARIDEVVRETASLQLRLRIWAERVVTQAITNLVPLAKKSLADSGYGVTESDD